jgi:hypothetical protein
MAVGGVSNMITMLKSFMWGNVVILAEVAKWYAAREILRMYGMLK